MTPVKTQPKAAKNTSLTQFMVLALFLASCGAGQIVTNKPVNNGAGSRIKVTVSPLGDGQVQVIAQPNVKVVTGSFVYCLSAIEDCKKNPNLQTRMLLLDSSMPSNGQATSAAHRVAQPIDAKIIKIITVSAVDFASRNPIWAAVNLEASSVEEEKTTDIQNPAVQPPTTNLAIDRFEFDRNAIERASQKLSGIDFDYAFGQKNLHPTQPMVRVLVANQSLVALRGNIGVVLGGYALSDSSRYISTHTAVSVDQQGALSLVGENLQPATIYKMRVHFFDRSDRAQARYLGSSSRTYNFVTDGMGDNLSRMRARIVMRGLAEESDWDMNRYDRSKDYTHGAGGWCHIFYNWVITPYLKTRSGSENTHYSQSYWSGLGAVTNGSALVETSSREPIMGDYFRVGSHAAMILAYDVAKKQFATLEGNFNNSVEFYQRSPSSLSWVGHINVQMLKDTALQQLQQQ